MNRARCIIFTIFYKNISNKNLYEIFSCSSDDNESTAGVRPDGYNTDDHDDSIDFIGVKYCQND